MTAPAVLLVPNLIWESTLTLFGKYAATEVEAGCFWYGHKTTDLAIAGVVGIPRQRNYPQHFEIDADDLAALTEVACASGLVAVAQLHSHPACDVQQSPWDEQRVISQNVSFFSFALLRRQPLSLRFSRCPSLYAWRVETPVSNRSRSINPTDTGLG